MPRLRALVLLGLFLMDQAACTSWQLPKVTPQEYAAQRPDSTATFVIDGRPVYDQPNDRVKMRLTMKGEQGPHPRKVVLTGVRFSADSVFGRDHTRQPIAYTLRQVAKYEVRGANGGLTLLAVLGVVIFVGGAVGLACSQGNSNCYSISY
jgi:hypothetical protein